MSDIDIIPEQLNFVDAKTVVTLGIKNDSLISVQSCLPTSTLFLGHSV